MTADTSTRSTLAELIDGRIARFDTRTLDWDALKFQEKVNPNFSFGGVLFGRFLSDS